MNEQNKDTNNKEITRIYYLHRGDNVPFYIGKTIEVDKRENKHKKTFGDDVLLEILDEIPTKEWLFWECHYIHLFLSWGFSLVNVRKNGGGGVDFHSDITKYKISESNKGKIISEETKNKMSESGKGKPRPKPEGFGDKISKLRKNQPSGFKDKNHSINTINVLKEKLKGNKNRLGSINSDLTRIKISENSKGITRNNKPVLQYDLSGNFIKEWSNITEANQYFSERDCNSINHCCNGNTKTSYGFIWRLKDNDNFDLKINVGVLPKHTRNIIQYDLDMNIIKEWNSISEASKILNIPKYIIHKILDKRVLKSKIGFIFKYKDNE